MSMEVLMLVLWRGEESITRAADVLGGNRFTRVVERACRMRNRCSSKASRRDRPRQRPFHHIGAPQLRPLTLDSLTEHSLLDDTVYSIQLEKHEHSRVDTFALIFGQAVANVSCFEDVQFQLYILTSRSASKR